MREYVGCKVAGEISKVRNPANKLSTHLLAKSASTPKTPTPEKNDMALDAAEVQKAATAIAKKMFVMSDVAKAHYIALDDAAQDAFLEKSTEDQTKEAEAAKAAKDQAVLEAEAAKSGKTANEVALQKSVDEQAAQIAELQKAAKDSALTAEIEKAASGPAYDGFPGGVEKLAPLLKSARLLPEADRTAFEDALKSQASLAKRMTGTYGARPTETELEKSAPAHADIEKKAKQLMEKDPELSYDVAKSRILTAHPELVLAGLNEEAAARN